MNTMLRIDDVSKEYRLGVYGGSTIREDLQSWWAKKRGKEDPNKKIGATNKHISGDRLIALKDISFDVQKGEAIGIIGRNGAGKSTLLKLISGVTAPTKGVIYLNGRITSMLEVGTGFHKELTGRENVYLNGVILGMTKSEISRKFDEIVDFSEVGAFIDTPVKRYSSGMYVKLAFSVAAHLNSEIVIMDEVLAVGDMDFQNKCIDKMKEVSKTDGRTILYVSHNMNTIRQLCRRCIVLNKGELVYQGEVEQSIKNYIGSLDISYASYYDITNNRRTENAAGCIRIYSILLLGRTTNIFGTFDEIRIQSEVFSEKRLSNVQFMLIIFSKEGYRVGMSESDTFEIDKGKSDIVFCFSHNTLPDGDYYTELNIVERNALGGYDKYEGVVEAFPFHIRNETKLVVGKEWDSANWGYAFYPHIKVMSILRNQDAPPAEKLLDVLDLKGKHVLASQGYDEFKISR